MTFEQDATCEALFSKGWNFLHKNYLDVKGRVAMRRGNEYCLVDPEGYTSRLNLN